MSEGFSEQAIAVAVAWIRSWTDLLRRGAPQFVEGHAEDAWTGECQRLDVELRRMDDGLLAAAIARPEGGPLMRELVAARTEFERAAAQGWRDLKGRRADVRGGRRALRGYAAAQAAPKGPSWYFDGSA